MRKKKPARETTTDGLVIVNKAAWEDEIIQTAYFDDWWKKFLKERAGIREQLEEEGITKKDAHILALIAWKAAMNQAFRFLGSYEVQLKDCREVV